MSNFRELQAGAERLVNLDEHLSLVEDVAIALRLGEQSDLAAKELQNMDREFLNGIVGQRSSGKVDVGVGEGPESSI